MTASVAALLANADIEMREARLLLAEASGMSTAVLAAFPEREVEALAAQRFVGMAQRRASGEPVAYILGKREFYGREFAVTPAVLIPRPETELLVELALARIAPQSTTVLDLGTGSGAVAVSIACEACHARVTGVDISSAALDVARANAQRLAPDRKVSFTQSNWFDALGDARYDLIVGNPPYVAEQDAHLHQGDLRFEPRGALASGPVGLDALASICAAAPCHLKPGAWLLLEHGYDQGEAARELLICAGLLEGRTWRDLAGIERISGAHAA